MEFYSLEPVFRSVFAEGISSFVSAALSTHDPDDDDILDAGCLLDVLRLHRWQISSFEEQVSPGVHVVSGHSWVSQFRQRDSLAALVANMGVVLSYHPLYMFPHTVFNSFIHCTVQIIPCILSALSVSPVPLILIFLPPQDAHELFHVLTSSLEEERDRMPRVTHLFDMQSLEVNRPHSAEPILCTEGDYITALVGGVPCILQAFGKVVFSTTLTGLKGLTITEKCRASGGVQALIKPRKWGCYDSGAFAYEYFQYVSLHVTHCLWLVCRVPQSPARRT